MSVRFWEERCDGLGTDSPGQITRSCSSFVDDVRISASLEQKLDRRTVPVGVEYRTPQRGVPEPVLRVDRCASLQKRPDRLRLRRLGSEVPRR
jgi:hypothetical protein